MDWLTLGRLSAIKNVCTLLESLSIMRISMTAPQGNHTSQRTLPLVNQQVMLSHNTGQSAIRLEVPAGGPHTHFFLPFSFLQNHNTPWGVRSTIFMGMTWVCWYFTIEVDSMAQCALPSLKESISLFCLSLPRGNSRLRIIWLNSTTLWKQQLNYLSLGEQSEGSV